MNSKGPIDPDAADVSTQEVAPDAQLLGRGIGEGVDKPDADDTSDDG